MSTIEETKLPSIPDAAPQISTTGNKNDDPINQINNKEQTEENKDISIKELKHMKERYNTKQD